MRKITRESRWMAGSYIPRYVHLYYSLLFHILHSIVSDSMYRCKMKELKIENRFQETRVDEVSEKRELEVGSAWKKKKRRQEYKYSCLNCLKSYKRKGHLVEHQRIFCGKDKEQCCPYCAFRTYKKSNLKKHVNRKHCNVIDYDRQVRSLE